MTSVDEVWGSSDMVLKVKEPLPEEYGRLREGLVLFTYLHLAADRRLTEALIESGATCIAYETVETQDRRLPLLAPMSEVAGRLATQMGAWALEKAQGGRGILLGGVPGVPPAKVVVSGGGIVGYNAALIAVGMQADVWVLDKSVERMRDLEMMLDGRITLAMSNQLQIDEVIVDADLVVGAVLIPGARAPKLVSRQMLGSISRARCSWTLRSTRVAASRPRVRRRTRPDLRGRRDRPLLRREHARRRAGHLDQGADERDASVCRGARRLRSARRDRRDPALARGVNVVDGKVTYEAVAEAHGLDYSPLPSSCRSSPSRRTWEARRPRTCVPGRPSPSPT